MFGLTDKVFGNHRGVGCGISDHRNFGRAGKHINANAAIKHTFRLGHKAVARADQKPGRLAGKQAKCHRRDTLHTAQR